MAFKMKNPSLMKMAKMAGNNRVAMKMKQQDAAMKMKKDPMKMKKDPMKMKDPMDMKKDPMMMKKDPMMMKKDPMKMKKKKDPKRPVAEKIRDVEPTRKGRTVTKTKTRRIDGATVTKTKGPGFKEKSVMKMKKASAMKKDSDGDGIPDTVDADGNKTIGPKNKPKKKSDPYAKALKKDPKLPEYIKKRKSLTKGTPAYNANQNKINAAYGKGPMRDVKEKVTTLGTRKVTKIDTPGVERLKIVDTNKKKKTKKKNLITGIVTKFKRKRGKDKKFNTADDKVKTKSRKMFRETKLGKTKLGQKLVSKKNK